MTEYRDVEGSVAQQIVNDHKLKKGIAKGSRYGMGLLSENALFVFATIMHKITQTN